MQTPHAFESEGPPQLRPTRLRPPRHPWIAVPALLALLACGDGSLSPAPPAEPDPPTPAQTIRVEGTIVTVGGEIAPEIRIAVFSAIDTLIAFADAEGRFDLSVRRPEGEVFTVVFEEANDTVGEYLPPLKVFGPEDVSTGS